LDVNLEQSLELINELSLKHRGKDLLRAETVLLEGSWNGLDYQDMADGSGFQKIYLQNNLATHLFRFVSDAIGKKIKKGSFRLVFEKLSFSDIQKEDFIKTSFVGREAELIQLRDALSSKRCVQVYGAGGIGKTSLVSRCLSFPQAGRGKWLSVLWKSSCFESIQDLMADLMNELGYKVDPSSNLLKQFIQTLSTNRYLICIDSVEDIFSVEYGTEAWSENRKFLKAVSEHPHVSCVVLVGRSLLPDLKLQHSRDCSVGLIKLDGLTSGAAHKLFAQYDLKDEVLWDSLISQYRGNPLALKIIASYIQTTFDSSVSSFNNFNTVYLGVELEQVLKEQCDNLPVQHRSLMSYLASGAKKDSLNQSFTLSQIKQVLQISGLMQILNELENKSLIERCAGKEPTWMLQPIISKFIFTAPSFESISIPA
jgi:hypothetical protein